MIKHNTILGILLSVICSSANASNLGSFPYYSTLAKAPLQIVISAKNPPPLTVSPETFSVTLMMTPLVQLPKKVGNTVTFINDIEPIPQAAKFRFVFLRSADSVTYSPVNLLSSSIPVSASQTDILDALAGNDAFMAIARLAAQETDSECFKRQALVIATGPQRYANITWNLLNKSSQVKFKESPLSIVAIGLNSIGTSAFGKLRGQWTTISTEGISQAGESDLYSTGLRNAISMWIDKNVSTKNARETLAFALSQNGQFQADLLLSLTKYLSVSDLTDIQSLLQVSKNRWVRYACLKIFIQVLNNGKGIPTIEDFNKAPDEYVARAMAIFDRNK